MNARLATLIATAMLLALAPAPAGHAGAARFDLDGTWTGTIKCKSFSAGAKDKFTLTPTMRISQSGLDVGIALDYGNGIDRYVGLANPDAKKPFEKGEVAVDYCFTNDQVGDSPDFDELGRITVKTKPGKVTASFKGTSIFSDPGVLNAEAGTCKWSYKRTAIDFPNVPPTCLPGFTQP